MWIIRPYPGSGASQLDQVVKYLPANAGASGDAESISELIQCPGKGNGNLFQYSCLGNPMDRGAWQVTVHGIAKELDTTWRQNNNKKIKKVLIYHRIIINYLLLGYIFSFLTPNIYFHTELTGYFLSPTQLVLLWNVFNPEADHVYFQCVCIGAGCSGQLKTFICQEQLLKTIRALC